MRDFLLHGGMLLGAGGGVAAGASTGDLRMGALAGSLSALSGLLLGVWNARADARRMGLVPDLSDLQKNHDLARIAGIALQRAIEQLGASERGLRAHAEALGKMAKEVENSLESLRSPDAPLPEYLAELEAETLSLALDISQPIPTAGSRPDLLLWSARVKCLAGLAGIRTDLPTSARRRLVHRLAVCVPFLLRELLKRDAVGQGPSEGRAWPAFLMRAVAELLRGQESIRFGSTMKVATLRSEVEKAHSALENSLNQSSQLVSDQLRGEILSSLRGVSDDICSRLERLDTLLRKLQSRGLVAPGEFAETWHASNLRILGKAGRDQHRADQLRTVFVGQLEALAATHTFLDPRSPTEVLCWEGKSGVGKSRLLLKIANDAVLANWLVLFVTEVDDSNDLGASVELLCQGDKRNVLLLWDDYTGRSPNRYRDFLEFERHLPPALRNCRVKRIVTCWPANVGELRGLAAAAHERAQADGDPPTHEIKSLGFVTEQGDAFIAYMRSLAPDAQVDWASIARRADGRARVALFGVSLALAGKLPADSAAIEGEFFFRLVAPWVNASAATSEARVRAIWRVALLGPCPVELIGEQSRDILDDAHASGLVLRSARGVDIEDDLLRDWVLTGVGLGRPPFGSLDVGGRLRGWIRSLGVQVIPVAWLRLVHVGLKDLLLQDLDGRIVQAELADGVELAHALCRAASNATLLNGGAQLAETIHRLRRRFPTAEIEAQATEAWRALASTVLDFRARLRCVEAIAAMRGESPIDLDALLVGEARVWKEMADAAGSVLRFIPKSLAGVEPADGVADRSVACLSPKAVVPISIGLLRPISPEAVAKVSVLEAQAWNGIFHGLDHASQPGVLVEVLGIAERRRLPGKPLELLEEEAIALMRASCWTEDESSVREYVEMLVNLRKGAVVASPVIARCEAQARQSLVALLRWDQDAVLRELSQICSIRSEKALDSSDVAVVEANLRWRLAALAPSVAECLTQVEAIASIGKAFPVASALARCEAAARWHAAAKCGEALQAIDQANAIQQLRLTNPSVSSVVANAEVWIRHSASKLDPTSATALGQVGCVRELRELSRDPKHGLAEATMRAMIVKRDADWRVRSAQAAEIQKIRSTPIFDTHDIARVEACAHVDATVGNPDPDDCVRHAEAIRLIRSDPGLERARRELDEASRAKRFKSVNDVLRSSNRRVGAARYIESRASDDTTEIALWEAKARGNASCCESHPLKILLQADAIASIRANEVHNTREIAYCEVVARTCAIWVLYWNAEAGAFGDDEMVRAACAVAEEELGRIQSIRRDVKRCSRGVLVLEAASLIYLAFWRGCSQRLGWAHRALEDLRSTLDEPLQELMFCGACLYALGARKSDDLEERQSCLGRIAAMAQTTDQGFILRVQGAAVGSQATDVHGDLRALLRELSDLCIKRGRMESLPDES